MQRPQIKLAQIMKTRAAAGGWEFVELELAGAVIECSVPRIESLIEEGSLGETRGKMGGIL